MKAIDNIRNFYYAARNNNNGRKLVNFRLNLPQKRTGKILPESITNKGGFQINQYELQREKLNLRLAVVSDLHYGLSPLKGPDELSNLIELIKDQRPDIVFMPGDIAQEDMGGLFNNKVADIFKSLRPPLGIFACPGSHEHDNDMASLFGMYEKAGIKVLVNGYYRGLNGINIVGFDDIERGKPDWNNLQKFLAGQTKKYNIVLAHNPDIMDHQMRDFVMANPQAIDLVLSGHLHGGEISLGPFSGIDMLKISRIKMIRPFLKMAVAFFGWHLKLYYNDYHPHLTGLDHAWGGPNAPILSVDMLIPPLFTRYYPAMGKSPILDIESGIRRKNPKMSPIPPGFSIIDI